MNDRTPEQIRSEMIANVLPWVIGYFVIGFLVWSVLFGYYALKAKSRRELDEAFSPSLAIFIPLWPIIIIIAPFYALEWIFEKLKEVIARWKGFE